MRQRASIRGVCMIDGPGQEEAIAGRPAHDHLTNSSSSRRTQLTICLPLSINSSHADCRTGAFFLETEARCVNEPPRGAAGISAKLPNLFCCRLTAGHRRRYLGRLGKGNGEAWGCVGRASRTPALRSEMFHRPARRLAQREAVETTPLGALRLTGTQRDIIRDVALQVPPWCRDAYLQ